MDCRDGFEIDVEMQVELHESVKGFVFPGINRPVTKDSLSPYNISSVEGGGVHWAPSKQKLIADLRFERILLYITFF